MDEDTRELRTRAEEYLRDHPRFDSSGTNTIETSQLIHELSVYQVELEMQNNQLRLVQEELLNSNVSIYKLYNEAPVGYVIIDKNDRVLKANQAFLGYINAKLPHVLNRPLEECFDGENRLQLRLWMRSDKTKLPEIELKIDEEDASRYLQVTSADIDSWNGQSCRFLVFTDMTALIQAKRESAISAAAINAATEGCFVVDKNQRIVFVNPALSSLFGYKPEEMIGRHPRLFKSLDDEQDFTQSIWKEVVRGNAWQEEVWMRHREKGDIACMIRVSPMHQNDHSEHFYVAMVTDITDSKKYQEAILQQATRDSLTGLPNRTLLMDRLKHALAHAQREETYVAVMFMDLDGFKLVNDNFGHEAGDKLLELVAERLSNSVRETDTVARLGGDEFVFVLNEIHLENLEALCNKILESLSEGISLNGLMQNITASLGVAIYPEHSMHEDELLRLADQAMYEAKKQGKNQFVIAANDI